MKSFLLVLGGLRSKASLKSCELNYSTCVVFKITRHLIIYMHICIVFLTALSIWFVAQIEAYNMFGIGLLPESLLAIESGIKKLKEHYIICSMLNYSSERGGCFYEFKEFLKGAKRDFTWNISPFISKEEKPKFGTLYLSFTAFSALLSSISSLNIKYVENKFTREKWIRDFTHEMERINNMLFDYERDITTWRLDQITPVQVCEITQHFWKKFEGVCETRWRRDTGLENEDEFNDDKKFNLNNNQFEHGFSGFEEPVFNDADKIGSDANSSEKLFEGEVIDKVQKKVLFKKEEYVNNVDIRGNKLNKLFREGVRKRGEHERHVHRMMKSFNNSTLYAVQQLVMKYYKN